MGVARERIRELEAAIAVFESGNEEWVGTWKRLHAENESLKVRVAELEREKEQKARMDAYLETGDASLIGAREREECWMGRPRAKRTLEKRVEMILRERDVERFPRLFFGESRERKHTHTIVHEDGEVCDGTCECLDPRHGHEDRCPSCGWPGQDVSR